MPGIIDPLTLHVDDLPGIWAPQSNDQNMEDRVENLEAQATANLLLSVSIPEVIMRLLLNEIEIEVSTNEPEGYDSQIQGEWEEDSACFRFKRPVHLEVMTREDDLLRAVYDFGSMGMWAFEVTPKKFTMEKI